MSRRPPNPAADRAAQNQATIKTLLKLEGNKTCADCKRNKRIHRGMGTHISRVKSVDLDAWTDEQMQSVLQWGNSRANKYWEAKLAPGHVPSEAKIENFIRTKYESKRWVMDGEKPDPSTLDGDGDDDVPLRVVQEKQKLERSASNRLPATSNQPSLPSAPKQSVDLFGDDTTPAPRPSTTGPSSVARAAPPKAPPKQAKPGDSLLGLDFFGAPNAQPSVPAGSTPSAQSTTQSRPDLKQSILSLYASAPRQQAPSQPQPQQNATGSFSNAPMPNSHRPRQPSFGGMNDAFSSLSFGSTTSPPTQQSKPSPFTGLGNVSSPKSAPAGPQLTSPGLSGGGFFDTGPKPPQQKQQPPPKQRTISNASFGAFDSAPSPATITTAAAPTQRAASSYVSDLFDFSAPSTQSALPPQPIKTPASDLSSVFNLSKPTSQPQAASKNPPPVLAPSSGIADPWGTNDVWSTPDTSTAPTTNPPLPKSKPSAQTSPSIPAAPAGSDFGWGASDFGSSSGFGAPSASAGGLEKALPSRPTQAPHVAPDEEFGGWSSAAPVSPVMSKPPPQPLQGMQSSAGKPSASGGASAGFGGSEDLFSNVWE
ncbi:MAG: hypothetical protein M1824_005088 [Vezdaea acicularis]|nr:MAG: hypothetical protein M1824_005088 [Vezdaea acicularis]